MCWHHIRNMCHFRRNLEKNTSKEKKVGINPISLILDFASWIQNTRTYCNQLWIKSHIFCPCPIPLNSGIQLFAFEVLVCQHMVPACEYGHVGKIPFFVVTCRPHHCHLNVKRRQLGKQSGPAVSQAFTCRIFKYIEFCQLFSMIFSQCRHYSGREVHWAIGHSVERGDESGNCYYWLVLWSTACPYERI